MLACGLVSLLHLSSNFRREIGQRELRHVSDRCGLAGQCAKSQTDNKRRCATPLSHIDILRRWKEISTRKFTTLNRIPRTVDEAQRGEEKRLDLELLRCT